MANKSFNEMANKSFTQLSQPLQQLQSNFCVLFIFQITSNYLVSLQIMRQFFRSQYKLRDNLILLNYTKNLQKYSFLQTLSDNLESSSNQVNNYPVNKFREKFSNYRSELHEILDYDFSQIDLKSLQNKQIKIQNKQSKDPQQSFLNKHNKQNQFLSHKQLLNDLSLSYTQMQNSIYQGISRTNLKQSILTLTYFNCIDIKIWQKIVLYVAASYKSSSLDERFIFLTSISQYLKKFYHSKNQYEKYPFKFMYPESYMIDLIDFRNFFQSIENYNDFITRNDSAQDEHTKLQILQNIIYLIMKVTKKNDMNIYLVKSFFEKRIPEMTYVASRHINSDLHKSILYNIYFIYSYVHLSQSTCFQQIQKNYFQCFKHTMNKSILDKKPSEQVAIKSKQINKILSIWKLNGRASQQIYQNFIQSFLKFLLDHNLQKNYYTNFCLNLITAGIKDYQIINEIIDKCDKDCLKEDESIHMLKHYLNIINGKPHYESNYQKCQSIQNPKITKYFKNRQIQLFSLCLKQNNTSQDVKKQRSFEHRKVQKLWSEIIKKMVDKRCEVIQNAVFCNFEIDYLILSNQGPLAIEVQGGHYNRKEFNKENTQEDYEQMGRFGKKQMRQTIIKAYGIRTIRVHSQQKIAIYIQQSRNLQLGIKYLSRKIHQLTGLNLNDL